MKKTTSTNTLVLAAILTALVTILQFMGAFIRFGPFSISLVLIPIVIGAATCGIGVSTWLGFAFGLVVLLSGDAGVFLAVNVPGTIATVLVKGMVSGFAAGVVYKALKGLMDKHSAAQMPRLKKKYGICQCCEKGFFDYISRSNRYVAVLAAAIVCPVVNTGIFLLGCNLFFLDTISQWAMAANLGDRVGKYMILVLVGANFLFELAFNVVLSPAVVRIVHLRNKG